VKKLTGTSIGSLLRYTYKNNNLTHDVEQVLSLQVPVGAPKNIDTFWQYLFFVKNKAIMHFVSAIAR
jgi:hypothetical protein